MSLSPIELPRDELPHHESSMEWWYFVGHLKPVDDPSHAGFTIGFIVLRAIHVLEGCVGMVLFVNHEEGVYPARQVVRLFGSVYEKQRGQGCRFDFAPLLESSEGWSIEISQDLHYKLQLRRGARYAIDLDLRPGPAYLLGDRGVVDYHQGVELAYYVRPHLPARGRLALRDGRGVDVAGHMWLERQWGDADYTAARWKYLLIHASDDEQWIFFRLDHLRGTGLRKRFGCRMADGQVEQLREESIQVDDLEDGAILPVRTRIRVPNRGVDLTVVPMFGVNQYYRPHLAPPFFEGASRVTGSLGERQIDCWGMTEMANYGGGR